MLQMQTHNKDNTIELCHTSCVCLLFIVTRNELTACCSYSLTAAVCKTT